MPLNFAIPQSAASDVKTIVPYDKSIGQASNVLGWIIPTADRKTVDGSNRLSKITGRSAAARAATQATAGKQPLWVAAGGPTGKNGIVAPSVTFDNSRQDQLATNIVLPTGATAAAQWTKVAIVNLPAEPTANQYHDILSGQNTPDGATNSGHRLAVRGANSIVHMVGDATHPIVIATAPMVSGAWCILEASWDPLTSTAALSINGGAWVTKAQVGVVLTDSALYIGATGSGATGGTLVGGFLEALVFQGAAHLGGTDTAALRAAYLARAAYVYGLPI